MKRPRKVLLLGAGGMGMAPLALYLRGAGVRVEAFDHQFREPLRTKLEESGVRIQGSGAATPPTAGYLPPLLVGQIGGASRRRSQ